MSETKKFHSSLHDSLVAVQSELKAPKNQYNKFGGFNYRNCEDILEAVKPLLKRNNLVLIIEDEIVNVLDRIYIKATTTLLEPDGCSISTTAYARESAERKGMDSSQCTGSASSYARKYALNGLFCIDDTKDADHHHNGNQQPPIKELKPQKVTSNYTFLEEMQEVKKRLNKATGNDTVYYNALGQSGYEKSNQIPIAKQKQALEYFAKLVKQHEQQN